MQTPATVSPAADPTAAAAPSVPSRPSEVQALTVRTIHGDERTVEVRALPLTKMGALLERIGDVERFVELVTGEPEGFAASLDFEDLFRIDDAGQAMNLERAGRWMRRQQETDAQLRRLFAQHTA